jgi:hypothetical protein
MPKGKKKIILQEGAYRLCTTIKPDWFEVGTLVRNNKRRTNARVVYLHEIEEDYETKYDVYVVDVED